MLNPPWICAEHALRFEILAELLKDSCDPRLLRVRVMAQVDAQRFRTLVKILQAFEPADPSTIPTSHPGPEPTAAPELMELATAETSRK
jgi:hypothetical protein